MADATVALGKLTCSGQGDCVGGKHPDPPLDRWPLLAWSPAHATHKANVFTEDGAATVEAIALAACQIPNYEALAERFNTSAEHITQAVDYAVAAGFLT